MNNFLASIAVFSELCNSNLDLKIIIAEFAKSVFVLEKAWALNSIEVTELLKKHYDFDIPEAVVKTSLNKLVEESFLSRHSGKYNIIGEMSDAEKFKSVVKIQQDNQLIFEDELIKYYENFTKKSCSENIREELIKSFLDYLNDNLANDTYTTIISSFIIGKSNNEKFIIYLNQIKEGIVLLNGLRYTNDLNTIAQWNSDLNIYLDTEHLFNAVGYNGELYKRLFDEFESLIKEINATSYKKNRKKIIYLKYFGDTQTEVESFFNVAERIIRREENLTPNNIAMQEICRGCSDVSDIIIKKTQFYEDMKNKGIIVQEEVDYYAKPEYNIEDQKIIVKYKSKYPEEQIITALHSFTKINYLRRGSNNNGFEGCKHIIMTGKAVAQYLCNDLDIKNNNKSVPFVTNIYFITNRLWFKLNKGLSKSKQPVLSLDTITKAQMVLASQVNKSIEKRYIELQDKMKKGVLRKETAQEYYYHLREKAKRPEEINVNNLKESMDIIFEDLIEKYEKEKSLMQKEVEEGKKAKSELKTVKYSLMSNERKTPKFIIRLVFNVIICLVASISILIPIIIYYIIIQLKTSNDTPLSILGLAITLVVEACGYIIKYKKFSRWLNIKMRNLYKLILPKYVHL